MRVPQELQEITGLGFKKAYFQKINEIIEYLRSIVLTADNRHIALDQTASGITIRGIDSDSSSNAETAESEAETYSGPFTVTYDPAKKTASVTGGWAIANGTWLTVEKAQNLKLKDRGYVCVSATLKEKTWTTKIEVAEPSASKYPVAYAELKKVYLEGDAEAPEGVEVKTEGTGENAKRYYETFKIIQYHVAVAMFMVVKYCPGVPQ